MSIPASEGNRHFDSIKALYDSGKLQILEPGEQPKFSDIASDWLKIDGQIFYSDFEWDDYFAETRESFVDNISDVYLRIFDPQTNSFVTDELKVSDEVFDTSIASMKYQ